MSEDIVERLSAQIESHENWEKIGGKGWETAHADLRDARDEIERLRAYETAVHTWVDRITSPPSVWADDEDWALINLVRPDQSRPMSEPTPDLMKLRHDHHGCRLCVKQRAEAADEIERLQLEVHLRDGRIAALEEDLARHEQQAPKEYETMDDYFNRMSGFS